VSSKALYVNLKNPCVVEPIEYQNLQEHLRGDRVLRKQLKQFLKRLVAQFVERVLVI
jgi:hypothetical protein